MFTFYQNDEVKAGSSKKLFSYHYE